MTLLAALLALAIGVTLGLLGGGGSILTVPVFVYVLGIDPKAAIAMSLPVVGGAALLGALQHWRAGKVSLRVALPLGASAMGGAYVGARLARSLNGQVQLALLAIVIVVAAVSMFRSARVDDAASATSVPSWPPLLAIGVGVGGLTGTVGAGGGFLIVPALVLVGRLPMVQAVGTSLLVIAMNTTAAFAGYRGAADVRWQLVLGFGAFALIGILAGSALIDRVPQSSLKRAFAALLLVVGSFMLWQYVTI